MDLASYEIAKYWDIIKEVALEFEMKGFKISFPCSFQETVEWLNKTGPLLTIEDFQPDNWYFVYAQTRIELNESLEQNLRFFIQNKPCIFNCLELHYIGHPGLVKWSRNTVIATMDRRV